MDFNKSITFFGFKDAVDNNINTALIAIARDEKKLIKKLSYHAVSREKSEEINATFLKHTYPTDIITFDYSEMNFISGEVYICPDVVKRNATVYNVSPAEEMNRVIFHGLLHLLGYGDETDEEKKVMREKENACLIRLETL